MAEVPAVSVGGVGATGPSAVELITNVLREHRAGTKRIPHPWRQGILLNVDACKGCDWVGNEDESHDTHVAAVVDAALGGLTREAGRGHPKPTRFKAQVGRSAYHAGLGHPYWQGSLAAYMIVGVDLGYSYDELNSWIDGWAADRAAVGAPEEAEK